MTFISIHRGKKKADALATVTAAHSDPKASVSPKWENGQNQAQAMLCTLRRVATRRGSRRLTFALLRSPPKPVASPSKMSSFANPTKSSVAKAVVANTAGEGQACVCSRFAVADEPPARQGDYVEHEMKRPLFLSLTKEQRKKVVRALSFLQKNGIKEKKAPGRKEEGKKPSIPDSTTPLYLADFFSAPEAEHDGHGQIARTAGKGYGKVPPRTNKEVKQNKDKDKERREQPASLHDKAERRKYDANARSPQQQRKGAYVRPRMNASTVQKRRDRDGPCIKPKADGQCLWLSHGESHSNMESGVVDSSADKEAAPGPAVSSEFPHGVF
ncbi:hypothetical protein B0H14DRAFT_2568629 [Mycena olivaceomarginata]|nr:hypothetical protein B0H14DRAFT_2568629 [Mycena olivaceomarginata]